MCSVDRFEKCRSRESGVTDWKGVWYSTWRVHQGELELFFCFQYHLSEKFLLICNLTFFSDFCQTWNKCWKSSPSSCEQNSSVRKLIWFNFSLKHIWNIEVKLFFITVSSDLQQVSMTHSKPSYLTPILTTIEEWWPTLLCLEVGSEKGTGSCLHISAKPTRSTSWGSSGQMSSPHRSCTWQSLSSFHFSLWTVNANHAGLSSSVVRLCCLVCLFW